MIPYSLSLSFFARSVSSSAGIAWHPAPRARASADLGSDQLCERPDKRRDRPASDCKSSDGEDQATGVDGAYIGMGVLDADLTKDPQLSNVDHHGGVSTAPVAVVT